MPPAKKAAPAAKRPAKSPAGQPVSGGSVGSKRVAGERVSAVKRVVPVRKGQVLAAGERFRRDMSREGDSHGVSLLIELGMLHANRLEQIGELLAGDVSAWLQVKIGGGVAEVRVSNLVTEERQRSAALQRVVMDIHRMRDGGKKPAPAADAGAKAVNPLARIAKGRKS